MIEMAAPLPMQDVAEGLLALIGLPCVTGQRWTPRAAIPRGAQQQRHETHRMKPGEWADGARGVRHVFLRDMILAASIGVHAFEHQAPQRVRINIDLAVDDDGIDAGRDDLSQVVDYEKIAGGVRATVASRHVRLVETLAEKLAGQCLLDRRVQRVRVRVEKLDIFADTASVGVEIERFRATGDE